MSRNSRARRLAQRRTLTCWQCGNDLRFPGRVPFVVSCRCGSQTLFDAEPAGGLRGRKLTTDALIVWAWEMVKAAYPDDRRWRTLSADDAPKERTP